MLGLILLGRNFDFLFFLHIQKKFHSIFFFLLSNLFSYTSSFSRTCFRSFFSFSFDRYLSFNISSGLNNFILSPMIPFHEAFRFLSFSLFFYLYAYIYSLYVEYVGTYVCTYIHNTHILFIFCSHSTSKKKRKLKSNKASGIQIEHFVNRMGWRFKPVVMLSLFLSYSLPLPIIFLFFSCICFALLRQLRAKMTITKDYWLAE